MMCFLLGLIIGIVAAVICCVLWAFNAMQGS